ncbi:MAG TPA: hypothetical protein VMF66_09095 [Candidatus Acidoferrum sp.]|nr:hypothetical protein [Candidatus Acidoferrum sp.]
MDRREVVNNPDEYDGLRERDPSARPVSARRTGLAGSLSSGVRPSAPSDARDWSFPRPTAESIPRLPPVQFPGSPSGPDQPVFSQLPNIQVPNRPVCLYLGPAGERCYRPALDNGFCPSHQPNSSPTGTVLRDQSRSRKKKAAATVGIIAAFWPLIEELVRQILRLLR